MGNGYVVPPGDAVGQLMQELSELKARVAELERPTGSQIAETVSFLRSLVTVVGTGGSFSVININTTTGIQWQDNAGFGSATFTIPERASGKVLITVSGNLMANIATSGGQMFTYVGYNLSGGNTSSTSDCLMAYAANDDETRAQMSRANIESLTPGATYTAVLTAAYDHFSTANGHASVNNLSIAVQVLP